LHAAGKAKNVFSLDDDAAADVVAVTLPPIPGTDPTVFGYSMLLAPDEMAKSEIKVGTNVFAVGYLYGYSGQKQNYPVTKFGKISVLSSERWYVNPEWKRPEEAYLVELQNTPGMSGAPLMTYGPEFQFDPFRFRELPPYVIGVVKGLMLVPVNGQAISQGIAAVEPAKQVKQLMNVISEFLKAAGGKPGLD